MSAWIVVVISTAYVGVLFLVAWWGDRQAAKGSLLRPGSWQAVCAYALTLAIYNTSWSFYGSVGRAAASGIDFLPIYIAPTLILICCQPLLLRIYTIAKAHHVNSIADFIASRYGKSQTIAAIVTIAALIAVLPYIALQLKAVGTSFDVLVGAAKSPDAGNAADWQDTPFAVAVSMALFAIIFGVRHVHSSEHHRGLMLAIAFESLVKIAAFLTVAGFIVFGMFGGMQDLLSRASQDQRLQKLLEVDLTHPVWISGTIISFIAFLCLPQAFHVAMVENESASHMRTARWLYPLYLAAFSIFMVPIAIAGLVTFGDNVTPDTFMIMLPISADATGISLLAYIGGFSAATGMVIVSVVALSTMLCNDVIVPAIMSAGRPSFVLGGNVGSRLLIIRRICVVGVLLLAYLMHRLMDQSYPLTLIGLVSFVAIAQLGPPFLGGLYWRRANRAGAASGIAAGMAVWAYTLLLPSFASDLPLISDFLRDSPLGPTWWRQNAPFGTGQLDIITHATIWSLTANIFTFWLVSLLQGQSSIDRIQADAFVDYRLEGRQTQGRLRAIIRLEDLRALVIGFLGPATGATVFDDYLNRRRAGLGPALTETGFVDLDAIRFTEQILSGAIGAASARVVMSAALESKLLSRSAAKEMLDEASEALRINHSLMRGMLESIPQGLCAFDKRFCITAWNDRFIDIVDLPRNFVCIGLSVSGIISFNSARGELGAEGLAEFIVKIKSATPGLKWPYVYERRRLDGRVIEIVFDRMPEGGYIATYTDVSERHKAAESLVEANEQLEVRVAERTIALERAKADAEQANASKTRFLAAASHDLLQPLHAARLFIAALSSSLSKKPEHIEQVKTARDRQREHARSAGAALLSTEHLLESLLDMSSLDKGIVCVKIQSFHVDILLSQLKVEYSLMAKERGLNLRVVNSSVIIDSDQGLLRRVLQNILTNAIRNTIKGTILLGCRVQGKHVRIEVWDTGVGIAPQHLDAIFEEFRQLDPPPSAERGIGLGLAIVQRTCELLGHKITVRSQVGQGSVFSVTVPRGWNSPMRAPSKSHHTVWLGGTRPLLVLCVDDEDVILEGTKALLREWGHSCVIAKTAEEARNALNWRIPDAVLMDYYVGEHRTGVQILEELQRLWGRSAPTALVTAQRTDLVLREAGERNYDILQKPIKPSVLRRWLNAAAYQTSETTSEVFK
ncbi:MAG: PAS domain-containing hybrid sensor histidine kinase/response regulator [Hyphomicrobiales bacterium]|nr:PAS domain-containing hybrid sensor histidine kinase/response regulator [Hyphomicrobiales bacterium]